MGASFRIHLEMNHFGHLYHCNLRSKPSTFRFPKDPFYLTAKPIISTVEPFLLMPHPSLNLTDLFTHHLPALYTI